jgi:hypothetical protein
MLKNAGINLLITSWDMAKQGNMGDDNIRVEPKMYSVEELTKRNGVPLKIHKSYFSTA